MSDIVLGLDIGGANLKAATPDRRARSVPFPMWKQPDALPQALAALVAQFPDATELAVTMTGELCDCFETKREGVSAITKAVEATAGARPVWFWSTDGTFLQGFEARSDDRYMKVAAANWHALATFVGNTFARKGGAILVDVGSTTTDIIPILDGKPVPEGKTDYDRIFTNELLYTGVRRTPVAAIMGWQVAAELFATTLDAYVLLGMIPESIDDCDTADGRPATKTRAAARLARMYCGDIETVPAEHIRSLAEGIASRQHDQISYCVTQARNRLSLLRSGVSAQVIGSGSGEFLTWNLDRYPEEVQSRSLGAQLGPAVSACAPAYALTQLPNKKRRK